METHADIILLWGNYRKFAKAIGIAANTAGVWLHRQNIPIDKWQDVATAAKKAGFGKKCNILVLAELRGKFVPKPQPKGDYSDD